MPAAGKPTGLLAMLFRTLTTAICLCVALSLPAAAQSGSWRHFVDPQLGYAIDLPVGAFARTVTKPNGLSLVDDENGAQLDVFGSHAQGGMSPSALLGEVRQADRIRTVTYQRSGAGWFVISGYYRRDAGEADDLIFYTKFMFNADRSAFSAFEVSYPMTVKRAMDPVVTHLEKSLRAPRAQ
jgi:hypothetical protein